MHTCIRCVTAMDQPNISKLHISQPRSTPIQHPRMSPRGSSTPQASDQDHHPSLPPSITLVNRPRYDPYDPLTCEAPGEANAEAPMSDASTTAPMWDPADAREAAMLAVMAANAELPMSIAPSTT
jgi:hypothetical protein